LLSNRAFLGEASYRRVYICPKRRNGDTCEHRASVSTEPLEEQVQALLLHHAATERPDELVTLQEGRDDASDVEAAESALRSAQLRRDEDAAKLDVPADVLNVRIAAHERAIAGAQER
jgi:hypothetical protein